MDFNDRELVNDIYNSCEEKMIKIKIDRRYK